MKKSLCILFSICIGLVACQSAKNIPLTSTASADADTLKPIPMKIGYGVSGPWFELYFTDPTDPASNQISGGPDVPLVASLDAARVEIDMAAYSLNLWDVQSSLLHAKHRGVTVRLVMESSNMKSSAPQALLAAGIPIVGDNLPGLMHNKFVVIDRSEVWTGSMNFTESGTYKDNNNLMHIRSPLLAQDYETEFDEMFVDHKFGPNVVPATPHPSLTLDGTALHVYFSPDDHFQRALVALLNRAKSSIYFMAYSFTADALGNAIRQRGADGVKVSGVMEANQVKSDVGTEYDAFRKAGADVRLDGNPGLMHHKVMIIDNRFVVMGSYNFTASAEKKNDENLVVIDNPQIAAQFKKEFQRVHAVAKP